MVESKFIPLRINISGNVCENYYIWKSFKKSLNNLNDIDNICAKLLILQQWAERQGIYFKMESSLFFQTMFSLFCKSKEHA